MDVCPVVSSQETSKTRYVWCNKDTLLFLQGEVLNPDESWNVGLSELRELRLKTRQAKAVKAFQTHWKKREFEHGPAHQILWLTLSPNGKWLLMKTKWEGNGPPEGFSLVNLSSGQWRDYALFPVEYAAWTRDSRHWITMGWTAQSVPTAEVHDVSVPSQDRRIVLDLPAPASPDQKLPIYIPLGQLENGRICALIANGRSRTEADFLDFPLSAKSSHPHFLTILQPPLPKEGRVEAMALSPHGDRLAWNVFVVRNQAGQSHDVHELWISKLDGSQMKKLGSIDTNIGSDPLRPDDDYVFALHWTPDGKQVSFVHRHTLWLIPAE